MTHDPDPDPGMTHWNYRVVRRTFPLGGEVELDICEVYYRDGEPYGYAERPPGGGTLDEVRTSLDLMLQAVTEPILDAAEISSGFRQKSAE